MRHLAVIISILVLSLSMSAELLSLDTLIDAAVKISPNILSAELTIEDAEIELKRALYKETTLPPNTINEKKKAIENAWFNLEKTKKLVNKETSNIALSVLKAQHGLRQKEISFLEAKRDLEIAVVKFDRGSISLNDLIGFEDKYTSSSDAKEQSKETLKLAKEKLCQQVGLDFDTEIEVDSKLEPLILNISLDELIEANKRYDSSYLSVVNSVSLRESELKQMLEDKEAKLTIRQKEISLEKTKIDLKAKESTIISNSRTTLSAYNSQLKNLEKAETEVTKAKKRLNEAYKQYEDGLITLNDLEDRQYQEEIALMKLVEAKWDLHLASLSLQMVFEGGD